MALAPSLRRRTSRRRRLAAAGVLVCVGGGAVGLLVAGGHGAPVSLSPLVAEAQVCVPPLVTCPPAPHTSSATAKPPPTHQPPPPTTSHGNPPPTHSGSNPTYQPYPGYTDQPVYEQPSGSPLPTLPPPSPGAPPAPPELAVQAINLQMASSAPAHPGADALIQGTLEAQQGADTYAVPHAYVTFTVTSSTGRGASVIPAELDSGDTGVVLVTVVTGDKPGDTVVHATSGDAAADVTIHADPAGSTPTPTPHAGVGAGASNGGNPRSDSRSYLIASLAALSVALMAGYIASVFLGRMPNPFQRRTVWGRRSSSGP